PAAAFGAGKAPRTQGILAAWSGLLFAATAGWRVQMTHMDGASLGGAVTPRPAGLPGVHHVIIDGPCGSAAMCLPAAARALVPGGRAQTAFESPTCNSSCGPHHLFYARFGWHASPHTESVTGLETVSGVVTGRSLTRQLGWIVTGRLGRSAARDLGERGPGTPM